MFTEVTLGFSVSLAIRINGKVGNRTRYLVVTGRTLHPMSRMPTTSVILVNTKKSSLHNLALELIQYTQQTLFICIWPVSTSFPFDRPDFFSIDSDSFIQRREGKRPQLALDRQVIEPEFSSSLDGFS